MISRPLGGVRGKGNVPVEIGTLLVEKGTSPWKAPVPKEKARFIVNFRIK